MSRDFAFIYIKAYKVGGTSTEAFFQPVCQTADLPVTHGAEMQVSDQGIVSARADFTGRNPPRFFNHMTASQIRAEVLQSEWETFRKFGNVRNPFALYLSAFSFWSARSGVNPEPSGETSAALLDYITSGVDPNHHDFFRVGGEVCLDDVIRFETLEADCLRIAKDIGYVAPRPLAYFKKREDARSDRPVSDFYTNTSVSAVIDRDAWYFEHFGYSTHPDDA